MTEAIALLRAALAGREEHAALCGIRSKPVWKERIKFSWVDCLTRESGLLTIVSPEESDALAVALLAELKEWREKEYGRRAKQRREVDRAPHPRALARCAAG